MTITKAAGVCRELQVTQWNGETRTSQKGGGNLERRECRLRDGYGYGKQIQGRHRPTVEIEGSLISKKIRSGGRKRQVRRSSGRSHGALRKGQRDERVGKKGESETLPIRSLGDEMGPYMRAANILEQEGEKNAGKRRLTFP